MHERVAILVLASCTVNTGGDRDRAVCVAPTDSAAPAPVPLGFTYGRTTGSDEVLAGSNTLVGIPIDIPSDGVLIGLGVIATGTDGEQVNVGLYSDDHGQPGTLIQASPTMTVVRGTNERRCRTPGCLQVCTG